MITRQDVAIAKYIVVDSGAVRILEDGIIRSNRGRKANHETLELLFIGLLLAIQSKGMATTAQAFRTLTEDLPLDVKVELGVYRIETTEAGVQAVCALSKFDFDNQIRRIREMLSYGEMSTPDIDDDERARRRGVVTAFSNTIMDLFAFASDETTMALDATGIWSWARKGRRRDELGDEILNDYDDAIQEELRNVSRTGDVPDATLDCGDDAEKPKRRRRGQRASGGSTRTMMTKVGSRDDGLGFTTSADPDADYGVKTSKSGKREVFFGYHEHTIVAAPSQRIGDNPKVAPPIIRRLELTPASTDVVEVSLRLIDSLPDGSVADLLVDSHYHYKKVGRWLNELRRRKVRQHHDLRSDEHGGISYKGVRFIDGLGHCPKVPQTLEEIQRPGPMGSSEEKEAFTAKINQRMTFALRIVNQPDEHGSCRLQCPALAGKVGCALRPGTVAASVIEGIPLIENPPNPEIDRVAIPPICQQQSIKLTPPERIRKLQQPLAWGSKPWEQMYRRRTYVEGSYGGRKNDATENLKRGLFKCMGLTWANIYLALVASSYNLRMVRNWNERSGLGDPNHPFFTQSTDLEWLYADPEQVDQWVREHLAGNDLSATA